MTMDPNETHDTGILLDALKSMEEAFVAYDASCATKPSARCTITRKSKPGPVCISAN